MLRPFLTLALASCLTGCTMNQNTITEAQALARVEQLIHDTAAVLDPRPQLELIPSSATSTRCLDPGKSEQQVIVNRSYWLRKVPAKQQHMTIARQVRAEWERRGHLIVSTGGFDVGRPSIGGKSRPDGFNLALVWAEGDNLYLGAASTCVWRDGTPIPNAR